MFASRHTFPELPNSSCRNCLHEVKTCSPSCLQGFLQTSSCSSPRPSAYSERCCVPTLRSDGTILGILPTATLSFLFLVLPSDLFTILENLYTLHSVMLLCCLCWHGDQLLHASRRGGHEASALSTWSQSAVSQERGGSPAGLSECGDSDLRVLSAATQEAVRSSAAPAGLSELGGSG